MEENRADCLFIRIIWVWVTGGTIFEGQKMDTKGRNNNRLIIYNVIALSWLLSKFQYKSISSASTRMATVGRMEEWKGGRFPAALLLTCHSSGADDGTTVILEAWCGSL